MASKVLKGLAALFGKRSSNPAAKEVVDTAPSEVQKVFQKNLIDEFGEEEVKESLRILTDKRNTPEVEKLFYRENESLEDELVNLLEGRYMSSERLQSHPLNFTRRGAGASERYLKINDSGTRLTDLPGGPGDKALYQEYYGNMANSTRSGGTGPYKGPPGVLDEMSIADKGKTIDGKVIQDSLYDKSLAEVPVIERMMKETGKTETEIREAIVELANEGYEMGSPKRMDIYDDDMLRAFVDNKRMNQVDYEDFVTDIMERLDIPPETKILYKPTASASQIVEELKKAGVMTEDGGFTNKAFEPMGRSLINKAEETDDTLRGLGEMTSRTRAMAEIQAAEQEQIGEAMNAFSRLIDDGEDPIEATRFLKDALKRTTTKQKDGGRIHAAFGKFIGEGIMQATKLAKRGMKPFGQRQTYKQKVDVRGVSNDQFNKILEEQLKLVPDEVYDEPTGKGLHRSLIEAEAIITGQKLGLLNPDQRRRIAESMTEKVSKQIYDNPVSGLSNDYLEYMDDAVGRMNDILEIDRLGGDMTPKPIFDGNEMIGAQVDFRQLDKLGEQGKDNIIPFNPREKKFKGGLLGLLKRVNPQLEKEMGKPKGPFSTGHRSDHVADMEQIKNVSRTTDNLDDFADMEQMIMDSPRYNEAARGAMLQLIDYEKYRALLLDDNAKLERMYAVDPEGAEAFVRMLYKRDGSSSSEFAAGGIVNTLQSNDPFALDPALARQGMQTLRNGPTGYSVPNSNAMAQARQTANENLQNMNTRRNEIMGQASTTMGQIPQNEEMNSFLQTPTGSGFVNLNRQIDSSTRGLGQQIQQNREGIEEIYKELNPTGGYGVSGQNVLGNMMGVGNLFGTRSSYGN